MTTNTLKNDQVQSPESQIQIQKSDKVQNPESQIQIQKNDYHQCRPPIQRLTFLTDTFRHCNSLSVLSSPNLARLTGQALPDLRRIPLQAGGDEGGLTEVAGERRLWRILDPDEADKEWVCWVACRTMGGLETKAS